MIVCLGSGPASTTWVLTSPGFSPFFAFFASANSFFSVSCSCRSFSFYSCAFFLFDLFINNETIINSNTIQIGYIQFVSLGTAVIIGTTIFTSAVALEPSEFVTVIEAVCSLLSGPDNAET